MGPGYMGFFAFHFGFGTHTHTKKRKCYSTLVFIRFLCVCVCAYTNPEPISRWQRHCLEGNCVPTCLPILPNRSSHRQCVLQRFPGSPFFLSFFAGRLCWLLAPHGTVFRSTSNRDTSFSTQGRCRSALHFTNHDHLGETTCKQG